MKGIDLFCASPASTAICVNLDQHSMVSTSRAIDRHNPHLNDPRRRPRTQSLLNPSSSIPSSSSQQQQQQQLTKASNNKKSYHDKGKKKSKKKSSSQPPGDFFMSSPPGSSRYLLSDSVLFDVVSEFEPDYALASLDQIVKEDGSSSSSSSTLKPSLSPSCSSSSTRSHDEVVVLRVSLHCKGCVGKVRKHISKMQGVKSFNIDYASKKVTIVGDVTPSGVLASVSRVKSAQLWPSSSSPSSLIYPNSVLIK